ncbi:MAG: CRISPR-associated protein Cas4 [Thermoanaerobaculia bacterium]
MAQNLLEPRWLFSNYIEMEKTFDLVEIGKIISEESFKREKYKEFLFDDVKIDFLMVGDEIIVNEVKKSKKLEEAHIWQVKFYIYRLREMGLNCKRGIIRYPKLMKKLEVELQKEDIKKIEGSFSEIKEIINRVEPPAPVNKPYCKKCAYYEFCFI